MSDFAQNIAVVIGINNYENGISKLSTAVNDAKRLSELLRDQHGYELQYVLLNEQATLENLTQLFSKTLPQKVTSNDRLLFYFAGHGIALAENDGPQGYLVPQDARAGDKNRSLLSMHKLHDYLENLSCRHLLAIFDCCFAGAIRWSTTRDLLAFSEQEEGIYEQQYQYYVNSHVWQILTSSGSDEKALDVLSLQDERGRTEDSHSPFAKILFDAIGGEADFYPQPNGDGIVTASDIFSYLENRLPRLTLKHQRNLQTPGLWHFKKHEKGQYIFEVPGRKRSLKNAPELDKKQNPYQGLNFFTKEKSNLFFGRTELIDSLHNFIKDRALTIVLGASGSGKSSLVRAGLIPKLEQDNSGKWYILEPVRPGEKPLQSLNQVLEKSSLEKVGPQNTLAASIGRWIKNSPHFKLVLFIDQCEEIITLCQDEEERKEFFQQILMAINAHRDKFRVVLALRSDFEPQIRDAGLKFIPKNYDVTDEEILKDRWQSGRFVVTPMTREELREAIEKPAEAKVMYFKSGKSQKPLVDQIIDEVADMPGALPLLSFTLSELYIKYFERQKMGKTTDRSLTREDYEELGGVIQSLTNRADKEYNNLIKENPAYEQVIRDVMLRMVAISGGELARRRVPKSELVYQEPKNDHVQKVIKHFVKKRLLVEGSDSEKNEYVEPAHDALIRGWTRINFWLREEKEVATPENWWNAIERTLNSGLGKLLQHSSSNRNSDKNISKLVQGGKTLKVDLPLQRQVNTAANNWLFSKKTEGFLWDNDPRLPQLREVHTSNYNWFNQVEANFVQASVRKERKNTIVVWSVVSLVVLGSIIFSAVVRAQWRNSVLNQANSTARLSLALFDQNEELDAFMEAIRAGKIIQEHDETDPQVMRALQKVLYEGRERNRFQSNFSNEPFDKSFSFNPNTQILASGIPDGVVKLWNIETGSEAGEIAHDTSRDFLRNISLSADGKILASASANLIKLWDVETQVEIATFQVDGLRHENLTFSSDNKLLATNAQTGVKLWDVEAQEEISTLQVDPRTQSFSFSPDGETLVTSMYGEFDPRGKSFITTTWNIKTGEKIRSFQNYYNYSRRNPSEFGFIKAALDESVKFSIVSPDGKVLALVSDVIILLNMETGEEYHRILGEYIPSSISFSADSKTLASGNSDRTVKLWDVKTGNEILTLQGHDARIVGVNFGLDSKTLVSGSQDGIVRFWKIGSEGHIIDSIYPPENGIQEDIQIAMLSPDNKTIFSGSRSSFSNGLIKSWNAKTGKQIYLAENGALSTRLRLSPDGEILASPSGDNSILFFDAETWNVTRTIQDDCSIVSYDVDGVISFSRDSKIFAAGKGSHECGEFSIYLWNVDTGEIIRTLRGHDDFIRSIDFSSDHQTLAASDGGDIVRVWDIKTGEEIRILKIENKTFSALKFSPVDQILSVASSNEIKLWNLVTGKVNTLQGHDADVLSLSFSPDGGILASGSRDNTIKFWDIETGEELRTIEGTEPSTTINSVSFSSDGRSLVSGGNFGTVILWDVDFDLNSLIEQSCDWVRNYLENGFDVEERDRHLCDDVAELEREKEIAIGDGYKALIQLLTSPDKQAGIESFRKGDFENAIERFNAHLHPDQIPNDPEALIYLNNAKIATQQTYTIAISAPIGSDVNGSLEMLRGVAQAQDEINRAGGLNGVPIKILIADDGGDSETAKQIAEELVNTPEVLGVVGHYASDVTLATEDIYKAGNLTAISPVSTSVKLSDLRHMFRTVPSDAIAAKALADYMQQQLNKKKAVVFYNSDSAYSQSLKSEFSKSLRKAGGTVTEAFDLSDPDFNAEQSVEQAIERGTEVIVLLPNTAELDDALQVAKANSQRLPILGGDDVYTLKTLEAGVDTEGMVIAVPWHILASQTDFPKTSNDLWGGATVNWRTAMTYDATMALIEALKINPTREGIAQTLRQPDFTAQGSTGTVQFDASGDREGATVQLVKIELGNRAQVGYDFVPIP